MSRFLTLRYANAPSPTYLHDVVPEEPFDAWLERHVPHGMRVVGLIPSGYGCVTVLLQRETP